MVAARLNSADDHLELQVRIVLKQTRFKVRRRSVIGKIHSAPFNIEDTVRRCAGDRRKHTTVSTGEARAAAQAEIGAQVLPHREDCEVIRPDVGRSRQTTCDVAARFVNRHKVEASIGAHIYAVVGLIVQLEVEWQGHKCIAIVGVITGVCRAWHDRIGAVSYDVLARRTTGDVVIPSEGRITIASFSSDRPSPNARRHAASESEMHRELGSLVAVDDLDTGHAAASITRQSQIARADRGWINSLVKVHVILVVARRWR